jgi:hypothetical protein
VPTTLVYIHRAKLYDLLQDRLEVLRGAGDGSDGPATAIRARFRIRNRQTGELSGEYTAVYGLSGDLTAVPIRMIYQPRWWLRTELTLDDASEFAASSTH